VNFGGFTKFGESSAKFMAISLIYLEVSTVGNFTKFGGVSLNLVLYLEVSTVSLLSLVDSFH
jgi:hypothetical protein